MLTVTITVAAHGPTQYRATGDNHESVGSTPGVALDALAAQLNAAMPMSVVVDLPADELFTAAARRRLDHLKQLYRAANDGRATMTDAERDEMEQLFDAEFAASERRAAALASGSVE